MGRYSKALVLHAGATTEAVGETFVLAPEGNTTAQENVEGAFKSLVVQITGVTTGVITFQGNVDGTNWASVSLTDMDDNSTESATVTNANGLFILKNCGGLAQFRANVTTHTTGTFVITALAVT
jgi:hypothetical protein